MPLNAVVFPILPGKTPQVVAWAKEAFVARRDQLTAWAVEYLGRARDKGLRPMLDASMERRYSANPGEAFATGGGLQVFHNFEPEDDARIMSVREAFRNSVNLVFIRLMRDVVNYHLYREPESIGRILYLVQERVNPAARSIPRNRKSISEERVAAKLVVTEERLQTRRFRR